MNYFKNCTTVNDVKQLYRKLAKENHPDRGGSEEIMKAINAEFKTAIKAIASGQDLNEEELENEIINAEQYRNAINAIENLAGIEIELCGGWIWVGGNTYAHKEILKAHGFFFASKKVMWYFRSPEYKTSNRKKMDIEQIRAKYGTQKIVNIKNRYSLVS